MQVLLLDACSTDVELHEFLCTECNFLTPNERPGWPRVSCQTTIIYIVKMADVDRNQALSSNELLCVMEFLSSSSSDEEDEIRIIKKLYSKSIVPKIKNYVRFVCNMN